MDDYAEAEDVDNPAEAETAVDNPAEGEIVGDSAEAEDEPCPEEPVGGPADHNPYQDADHVERRTLTSLSVVVREKCVVSAPRCRDVHGGSDC